MNCPKCGTPMEVAKIKDSRGIGRGGRVLRVDRPVSATSAVRSRDAITRSGSTTTAGRHRLSELVAAPDAAREATSRRCAPRACWRSAARVG